MNELSTIKINTAEEANSAHKRIVGTVQDAIAIGEFLSAKKAELAYGQWGKWVEQNLEFDRTTAFRYIRLYGNREQLLHAATTDLTEAYRLLSSSEPEQEEQPKREYTIKQELPPIKDITPEVVEDGDETATHVPPVKSWSAPQSVSFEHEGKTPDASVEEIIVRRFKSWTKDLAEEKSITVKEVRDYIRSELNYI